MRGTLGFTCRLTHDSASNETRCNRMNHCNQDILLSFYVAVSTLGKLSSKV